jgi:hypothetical protein
MTSTDAQLHDNSHPRPIQLKGWAVLFTTWLNLGLFVLLNGLILREVISEDGQIVLPTSTQDAVWLVVVMWLVAYVSGFIVGLQWGVERRDLIGSSVVGYLIAACLHIAFIGIFPGTPTNSFDVLRSLVSFEPLPVYYVFAVLCLVLGPVVAGLAAYTGNLMAGEFAALRLSPQIGVDPIATIFAALLPVSVMLLAVSMLNYRDLDDVQQITNDYQVIIDQYNDQRPFNEQEPTPPIVFLHLDRLTDILYYAGLAFVVGVLIGVKRLIPSVWQSTLSAMLGLGVSMLLMFLLLDVIEPDTTPNINYEDIYTDELGTLRAPDPETFALFWFLPPTIAGLTALVLRLILNVSTSRQPQQAEALSLGQE